MTTPLVQSITEEMVAELEALASKATGGDWEYRLGLIRTLPSVDGYVPVAVAPHSPKNWRDQRDMNMQYIATANPATILALLAERKELVRDRERLDSGRIMTSERNEFGESYKCDRRGLDLRAMIDAAIDAARGEV